MAGKFGEQIFHRHAEVYLNRVATRPNELEESLIIYALVHDDGLQQIEVAQMLGRHKSWINRRKASLGSDPVFGLQVRSSEVNMNACLDRFVFNTLVQYTMSNGATTDGFPR